VEKGFGRWWKAEDALEGGIGRKTGKIPDRGEKKDVFADRLAKPREKEGGKTKV